MLAQLPKEKAADFIIECYEMAGVHVRRDGVIAENLVDNVMKHHGTTYTGYLLELFYSFVYEKTKHFALIKVTPNSYFINKLKDAYFASKNGDAALEKKKNIKPGGYLSGAEQIVNFLRFCDTYKVRPANPNWIAMANTLCKDQHISAPAQKPATYSQRLKAAKEGVMQYLEQHKPWAFSMEEVAGTAGRGNLNIAGAIDLIKN